MTILPTCAALASLIASAPVARSAPAWPPVPYLGAVLVEVDTRIEASRIPALCLLLAPCPPSWRRPIGSWPMDQLDVAACALWAPGYVYTVHASPPA